MVNRTLLGLIRPGRGWLAIAVLAGVLVSATYAGQSLLLTAAVAQGLRGELTAAVLACCAALALVAVRAVLVWGREVAAARGAEEVKAALRDRLYRHLLTLGPGYVAEVRTGGVLTTLVDSVEAIDRYVGVFLPQVLISVLGGVGIVAVLAWIDPAVAVLVAVTAVLAAAAPRLMRRRMRDGLTAFFKGWKGLSADYLDAVQGLPTLKAVGADERFGAGLSAKAWAFYRDSLRFTFVSTVSAGFVGFFAALGTAAAVGLGAWQYASGALSLTAVFAVLLLSREAFRPVTELMAAFHAGQGALPAAHGIAELLAARPPVPDTGTASLPGTPPEVVFEDVTFTYPGRERPALDGVSLRLAAGRTTAVVGPSGAGKSTLIRLLLRHADPTGGRVLFDGADLRDVSLAALRSQVAVVSQEVYLFHGTVAGNIAYGRAGASRTEIEQAARAAHAHEFIAELPDGYDTVIGERGLRLSGGQRQRLAIARALLADAPLLILDEATSSVDIAAERAVVEALERVRAGRTVLLIAHRLSTVADADHVVVLDEGRVAEAAAPAALLATGGAYARLIARQQEGAA
ncbi:ABC transporter ATP-binding protein [Nonomuraea rubra]|uniref:ABC-type multidrug transport system fused ATPase/permease subunit n=1 Tax=Nonomuraea rubra TaxID=46180 RepID=A0A7X0NVJ0_9ACTN|nr:ABC transporter ATP-binding protein [Nonomuraea rubra]MBB6550418.1 ABC-type multidrug transport system fused ATPase/permease subunit [Nonomuraea rubra]